MVFILDPMELREGGIEGPPVDLIVAGWVSQEADPELECKVEGVYWGVPLDQSLCEGVGKPECTGEEILVHADQQLCLSTAQEPGARVAHPHCSDSGQGGWAITECGLPRGRSLALVERTLYKWGSTQRAKS